MADAAIVSVIASGTVGVFGAALGALGPWFSRKNERDKRAEERRNDLRIVLDEAAQVLASVLSRLPVGSDAEQTDLQRFARELSAAITGVRAHSARLGVRVGSRGDVYLIYDMALETLVRTQWLSQANDRRGVLSSAGAVRELYAQFQDAASARAGVAARHRRQAALRLDQRGH